MISSPTTVVLENTISRVALVSHDQRTAKVVIEAKPQFHVISAGLQGPVGTVAADVLARAAAAEQAAITAQQAASAASLDATNTNADLDTMITDLNNAFVFHTGAISAQGG